MSETKNSGDRFSVEYDRLKTQNEIGPDPIRTVNSGTFEWQADAMKWAKELMSHPHHRVLAVRIIRHRWSAEVVYSETRNEEWLTRRDPALTKTEDGFIAVKLPRELTIEEKLRRK